MTVGFQNLAALFGLAAVAIPVLIHLLHRRRYDVVEWGAMQFLEVSRTTRRRILLEEILLMLLRMGVIAVFVVALAAPYATGAFLDGLAGRPPRDIVLLVDGSASMGFDDGGDRTPHEKARRLAGEFVRDLASDDRVALLLVREKPTPLVAELTTDHARVREAIANLPGPRGACDWPGAVEHAAKILNAQGRHARRDVIIFSDGQHWSWADAETMERWKRVAHYWRGGLSGTQGPGVFLVQTGDGVPPPPSNYALAPLRTSRAAAWTGQQVKFSTALQLSGFTGYERPRRIRLEVDGKAVRDLPVPDEAGVAGGQVGITFTHRFAAPGSHLVSVILEPDLPVEQRPGGYRVKDCLPADNRQDYAIQVHDSLPVLLVDGGDPLLPEASTFFVKRALEQSPDPRRPPIARVKTVSAGELAAAHLTTPDRPAVVVLADVPRLQREQLRALEKFVAEGGGALIALGARADRDVYNDELFREGGGLLPARLDRIAGEPDKTASPNLLSFTHPALAIFREAAGSTLSQARIARWWRLAPAKDATVAAGLSTEDPLLVERAFKDGRVMLCALPLDRSWESNLPGVLEYPVLVHELTMYLAGTRGQDGNVAPDAPLRYRPTPAEASTLPADLVLYPPDGKPEAFRVSQWPWTSDAGRTPGSYRLDINGVKTVHFVVPSDARESDLTTCTDEDRRRVAEILPVQYGVEDWSATGAAHDLWWLFLLLVCLLLAGEIWLTRRMARAQGLP